MHGAPDVIEPTETEPDLRRYINRPGLPDWVLILSIYGLIVAGIIAVVTLLTWLD